MIISRYLAREVILAVVAVTFILVLAFFSQQVVRYLNYAATGKIATGVLFELVSFEIPYLLALLLPLGLYLGILLAYGRLYADNEMAILHMYGYNRPRIVQLTFVIATFVALVVFYLMMWVDPVIALKRQQIMNSGQATVHLVETLAPGRFQSTPDGHQVMYVEQLSRDHKLAENLFIAQQAKQKDPQMFTTWTLIFANQGYQAKEKGTGDQFFVTTDGFRYEGRPGQNNYSITHFKKYAVRVASAEAHQAQQDSDAATFRELIRQYHNPQYAAELQWRFSIVISVLILALLAVPSSAVGPRQGRYIILLPAILIYITYIYLLFLARHLVETSKVPAYIGMGWVHVLMLGLVLIVYWQSQRRG